MEGFLRRLPKAELHVHIEGALEPELMLELADRNHVEIPYRTVEEVRDAFHFDDLQAFLDVYEAGTAVLRSEQDLFDLTWAYLTRAADDGVRRAEIFFDPQAHLERGLPLGLIMEGIGAALEHAQRGLGLSCALILCFLRDRPPQAAMDTLEAALASGDRLLGVGLDSAEAGNPPERFANVFDRARSEGLHVVAHAGEEGPPGYVWQALQRLHAERIDHGIRALEDPALVEQLAKERVPLTVCPVSNVRLRVVERLEDHPLPQMLAAGLRVTLNSDDPAYFGGYVGDVYAATQRSLDLTRNQMVSLARNSLEATFLSSREKRELVAALDAYVAEHDDAPA